MRAGSRWGLRFAPLLLAGVALAQAPDDKGVNVPFTKVATLTPQETLAQAKDYQKQMQDAQKNCEKLRDEAQKSKDVIKLNCVEDKIVSIKGHLAVTEKAMSALNDAIAKSDEGSRTHEFTRITILSQKVTVLESEAKNCVGEELTFVGNQEVSVSIDPNIPEDDPTAVPVPPLDPVPRPSESSPTT